MIYLATRCRTRAPASQTTTIGSFLYLPNSSHARHVRYHAAGPTIQNKENRKSDYNTHRGRVPSFSGQDTITPLYLYIANNCLLLY